MDSQFTKLMSSYHDNYMEFKTTGDSKYQTAYQSAQTGLDNILANYQSQSDTQKISMADFYKSGVEQKLREQQASMRELRGDLMSEKDAAAAAKLRAPIALAPPTTSSTSIPQIPWYYYIGAVGAVGAGYLLMSLT